MLSRWSIRRSGSGVRLLMCVINNRTDRNHRGSSNGPPKAICVIMVDRSVDANNIIGAHMAHARGYRSDCIDEALAAIVSITHLETARASCCDSGSLAAWLYYCCRGRTSHMATACDTRWRRVHPACIARTHTLSAPMSPRR